METCPHCNGEGFRWVCRVNPFAVKKPWQHSEKRTCHFCHGGGKVTHTRAIEYQSSQQAAE